MPLLEKLLLGWCILSIPSAIIWGALLRVGNPTDPVAEAKAAYDDAVRRGDTKAQHRTWDALRHARNLQLADEIGRRHV